MRGSTWSACSLLALFLMPPLAASAQQAVLAGQVTDAETGRPLAGVNVFIAGSTRGVATDEAGRFHIQHIPLGQHRIYVSMVGYQAAIVDSLLQNPRTYALDLSLKPSVLKLDAVEVVGERDEDWQERLDKFRRLFLGSSANAAETDITNPEVLSFETRWWGRLTARAADKLIIENRSLGYEITYFLKAFTSSGGTIKWDGEPLFSPLTPDDSAQAARWAENRRRAYRGSLRHFLRALIRDRLEEEGFRVEHIPPQMGHGNVRFRVNPHRFVSEGPDSTQHLLNFTGRLEITYVHEEESEHFLQWRDRYGGASRHQRSYIELNEHPVTVDHTGEIVEPYGATVYGYFAFERTADQVPKSYHPE